MALYNTVPAEESTLLAPKKEKKMKGLVAGFALAAFALGAVAATATRANEVEYKFSNNDDGTYTMWVDGGGKEGYYKIYNMCEDGGSKCWIQFDCLKNDKEFSDDC